MTTFKEKIRRRLFRGLAREEDLAMLYQQLFGLFQIQSAMAGQPVIRPLTAWAISPDAMVFVLASVQERREATVVEFGSGQSTLMLAAALKHSGGTLISVDHDPGYSIAIQQQVAACGLANVVRFVHAPLCDSSEGVSIRSYDVAKLADLNMDIALIDGPPSSVGALTRLVPLRWAARHLKKGGVMFLDDASRQPEKACLAQLAVEFPNFRQVSQAAVRGLVELQEELR